MRFERFVFKNQLERELLIGFTEHELHESHGFFFVAGNGDSHFASQ